MGLIIGISSVALLLVVMFVRALMFNPDSREKVEKVEITLDSKDIAKHLSGAIQYKTVSTPDPENTDWKEFEKLREYLVKTYPKIHEVMEREVISEHSLLYKWSGKNADKLPLALLSHMDVVPVMPGTEGDWEQEAFSGHIDETCVWGRGTQDMKGHLIAVCEAVEQLISQGYVPESDLYLCFGHNEEVVGSVGGGAKAIAETLEKRGVRLGMVIDEGGAVIPGEMFNVPNSDIAVIGIAEKGYADIKITCKKAGGHSSQPPKDNGLVDLAKILVKLDKKQFKQRFTYPVEHLFQGAGRHMNFTMRLLLSNLWITKPLVLKALSASPTSNALTRTTITPTMAEGSPAGNVLPQTAYVNVNSRVLHGEKIKDVEDHIRKCAKGIEIEMELQRGKEPSAVSKIECAEYEVVKKTIKEIHGDLPVTPYLMVGGTDSCFYEKVCSNIFRVGPFRMTKDALGSIHSTNEKIDINILENGVRFYIQLIYNYFGK
ncbi:MAG: M20 family peptidase [Eubacteriales bacterium]